MSIKVFAMTHKKYDFPEGNTYTPLQVGAKIHEDLGYLKDDSGDNISELNPYFAELSGMYWVWKNVSEYENVGICHYRRYPVNDNNQGMSAAEYEKLLEEYDLITSKLLELPNPYYYGFGKNHNIRDLDLVSETIKKLYPDYYPAYEEIIHGTHTYFGNIIVAPKKLYDEYCAWLFPIFFQVHNIIGDDLVKYDDYHKRVYGFISEILLLVYVKVRNLKAFECKIGMLGEKKETAELKIALADFFKKHDVEGAQKYFEEVIKMRPDVMMEASDITGELKICMQIIATYNFEKDVYEKSIIDYVDDYKTLVHLFETINKTVVRIANNPDEYGFAVESILEKTELFLAVLKQGKKPGQQADVRDFDDFNGYVPTKEALMISGKVTGCL